MSPLVTSSLVFGVVFAGALCGMALRAALPEQHQAGETRDIIKAVAAFIGTMTALVLGLLVASAKGTYDSQRDSVRSLAAKLISLDRVLAHYGPETGEIRHALKESVTSTLEQIWPSDRSRRAEMAPSMSAEPLYDQIEQLEPKTEAQRSQKTRAAAQAIELREGRWLIYTRSGTSISTPLLVLLVAWMTLTFLNFGLFAPRNSTAVAALVVCALSAAAAILLLLELDHPFGGLIEISSTPLREALAHMGQ